MEIAKWIGMGFGGVVAAVFCLFVYAFVRMAFVKQFTELALLKDKTFRVLSPGVRVSESAHQLAPLEYEYAPRAGAVAAAESLLLRPDGLLEADDSHFDGDPRKGVLALADPKKDAAWILSESRIYLREGDRIGRELVNFGGTPFTGFGYVAGLNEDWFLVAGDSGAHKYPETMLWQVSRENFETRLLEKNPYFTFSRPPKTFTPSGFEGVLLAIYRGVVSYGFGGDCSRPRYSILRAYTPAYPDGIDLARFSFKAGTIVDVQYQDGTMQVIGDPSRPGAAGKDRRPPRVWNLEMPAELLGSAGQRNAIEAVVAD
ncbi:hypothetical protein [Microbulbifer sp. ALW1]|uniref:hypothetical protein n=1 Tax=Microbulbifer sp. (strain ALW1) TaxID=1516059 RepID=UPI001358EDF4|nr:hypothetical protein [Microbulbifer sp. ALW1]